MTPAYDLINSPPSPFPFLDLKQDQQLQFFINPTHHNQASSSLTSPIFFNITHDQRSASDDHPGEPHKNQHKADKYILNGGSSDHQASPSIQPRVDSTEHRSDELLIFKVKHYEDEVDQRDVINSSADQWMSSKMRLMRRSTESPHNNNIIRVCSDCNTTKTPLWRSGPQGPKSLCNACGIRQRKARRAMAAAAAAAAAAGGNGTVRITNNSTTRTDHQVKKKEKKLRTSYTTKYKKPFKQEKISTFEDFAMSLSKKYSAIQRAFPKDEEEAAILLMALSCGLLAS